MLSNDSNKDWMIDPTVVPAQMSPVDPPAVRNCDRLIASIVCFTLGEKLSNHSIEDYILDHIELERECSDRTNLCLAWSDDVSLALCFIVSLIQYGGYSQDDLTQQYINWWMNGFMSPTGVCFTPSIHIKQTIEQMSINLAAESLAVITDENIYTTPPSPPVAALLRISPIAYFYSNHSPSVRIEVITHCVRAMFGQEIPIENFVIYIELLVNALNGHAKEKILQSIQIPLDRSHSMSVALIKLIDILRMDNNDIQQGVQQALAFNQSIEQESKWRNPYDSNQTILVTLYLQVSGALYYQTVPSEWFACTYAKETLMALAKWLKYEQQSNECEEKNLF
ncbi:unnamed protein product [Rotaria magnacalcarata]|uniref:Uncharacterized protein n=4 Tax=Rotaria magnacalcarata TaxID=392030 RepID=A0A819R6A5_9BILA|nr:unnamed protein product [Rotaria magnacalcarata]CAF4039487.1 unnamed protein product [Rotaria magnacalcarata]